MKPGAGQTGCTYKGKTGGPIRTEMPTATSARDWTGIASNPTARSSEQTKRSIRMIIPFPAFAGIVSVLDGATPCHRGPHACILETACEGKGCDLRARA